MAGFEADVTGITSSGLAVFGRDTRFDYLLSPLNFRVPFGKLGGINFGLIDACL